MRLCFAVIYGTHGSYCKVKVVQRCKHFLRNKVWLYIACIWLIKTYAIVFAQANPAHIQSLQAIPNRFMRNANIHIDLYIIIIILFVAVKKINLVFPLETYISETTSNLFTRPVQTFTFISYIQDTWKIEKRKHLKFYATHYNL